MHLNTSLFVTISAKTVLNGTFSITILSNFFQSDCNITDGMYKGVGGWWGGGGGWEAEGGLRLPLRHRQQ